MSYPTIERHEIACVKIEGPAGRLDLQMARQDVDRDTSVGLVFGKPHVRLERSQHDAEIFILDECSGVDASAPSRFGLQPMQLKHRGKSHWWLLDPAGRVVDLTLGPRETSSFPYHRGKRRPFRYTPAGLSRRAQTIVERVEAARR